MAFAISRLSMQVAVSVDTNTPPVTLSPAVPLDKTHPS